MDDRKASGERLYLGVDIGGTKVQASVISESGAILERQRNATPRVGGPEQVLALVEDTMQEALDKGRVPRGRLTAIGVAVPGVVDPDTAQVVVTPNMSLSGVAIGAHLESRFRVPVAIGNDGNFGTLGESWLGTARNAKSAIGIWVGTGIGAGIVRKGKLWRGAREAAGEIGHIVMQIGGPQCGCGNHGCFEALASRTAIERDIRTALADGRRSILTDLSEGDLSVIRSGTLKKAIKANDGLVTEVLHHAAEVLGYACLTVRHLLDPEVIVLGGGLIEACSDFMMPIVEGIVAADRLPGARDGGHVLLSALGDDAVVLGAVALARKTVGRSPFKKRFHVKPTYADITRFSFGEISVGKKTYHHDIYMTVSGKVREFKGSIGGPLAVETKDLEDICKGGPEMLFIGAGEATAVELSEAAQRYLGLRAIRYEVLPTANLIEAYNKSKTRKAALIRVMR